MTFASDRPRILAIGHAVHPTGLARVFQSIFPYLADSFDIIQFGLNFYDESPTDWGWTVEPNSLLGDTRGVQQLPGLLDKYQPHLVLFCYDYWLFDLLQPVLEAYQGSIIPKSVYYCPVEGEFTNPNQVASLAKADLIVTYTQFGHQQISACLTELGLPLPSMTILPHGLESSRFFPLKGIDLLSENRSLARRALFPDRPQLEDAFIILNANRNVPRKRIDLTLETFVSFAADKPENVYIYLHMGMQDSGIRIMDRAQTLGIENRLLTTTSDLRMPHISDEQLNLIYNACDVGINTSTGEGWGLVAFEHAATGAVQITPKHSACTELWLDDGLLVPVIDDTIDPLLQNTVRLPEMVSALNQVYANADLRRRMAISGYQMVTKPCFTWRQIASQWEMVLLNLLNGSA